MADKGASYPGTVGAAVGSEPLPHSWNQKLILTGAVRDVTARYNLIRNLGGAVARPPAILTSHFNNPTLHNINVWS